MEMLDEEEFPRNTLFCGDAGFVGYALWTHILSHGFDFLVRVGGERQSADRNGGLHDRTKRPGVVLAENRDALGTATTASAAGESANREDLGVDADQCLDTVETAETADREFL